MVGYGALRGGAGFLYGPSRYNPAAFAFPLAAFSKSTWKSLSELHDVRWKENVAHAGNSFLVAARSR